MKTRRRFGVGAAGVAALLFAAPTLASSEQSSGTDTTVRAMVPTIRPGQRRITQLAEDLAGPKPTTTTTTAPPPPPPPTEACPVAGYVTFEDTWLAPRQGHRHQGADIMAPMGAEVLAPVSGTVEHRSNPVGGLSYHMWGDDGSYYYGTHLSAYGNSGWVPAGTVIGYVGNTGNAASTPPHLHFEIHPGGRGTPATNPYPIISAWCAGTNLQGLA